MSGTDSLTASVPPTGETTVSVQWRCKQMAKHDGTNPLAVPCESCYSLIQTNVVVPYLPKMPFRKVVEGG